MLITSSSREISALTTATASRESARPELLESALYRIGQPFEITQNGDGLNLRPSTNGVGPSPDYEPKSVPVPAFRLENLGDAAFRADHGLRFAYVAGAMANGIGSAEVVEAMARAGMLGFFGAAGLSLTAIEAAINRLSRNIGD